LHPLSAYYTLNTAAAKGSVPVQEPPATKVILHKRRKKKMHLWSLKKNQESPASFRCVRLHTEQLLFQVLNVDGSCSLNRAELENISTPSNSVTEHSELWTNRETSFKPCKSIYRNRKAKCLRKIDVRTVAY
jgi:hypothetical protein